MLALWHMPLPWRDRRRWNSRPSWCSGIWTALVLATVFIGGYAWSVAEEARRLRDAVAATQLALAREQRVSAVGALAAAAAHELGSPLGDDRRRRQGAGARIAGRFAARRGRGSCCSSQSERCRQILAQLAHQPDEDGASPYTRLPISALVEAAGALHHDPRIRLIFATTGDAGR